MDATTKVLLLVATTVEQEQVKAAAWATTGRPPEVSFHDEHAVFDLGTVSRANVLLARCEPDTAASGGATLTAQKLIERLRPDYVILTGICFGLRKQEQRLGDILISTQLRILDPVGHVEVPRGARPEPSVVLLNRCYPVETARPGPVAHFGVLLTSSTLLNSAAMRDRLIAAHPDALGGEMESGWLCADAAEHGTHWIVIKAISDWGVKKTARHQGRAARIAADFVVRMIGMGGLDTAPPYGEKEGSRR